MKSKKYMNTLIRVQGWGDFDIPITIALMGSVETLVVKDLVLEFKECFLSSLPNSEITENEFRIAINNLSVFSLNTYAHKFVDFLKKKGFKDILEISTSVAFND